MDNNENNQSFQSQSWPQMTPQSEMQPTPQPEMQPPKKNNTNNLIIILATIVIIAVIEIIVIVLLFNNGDNGARNNQGEQGEQGEVTVSMMQRDTQRRDDMAMLVTQLNNYQANNRGQLPHQTSPNKQVEAYNSFISKYMSYSGESFTDPLTGDDYEVSKFIQCSSSECEIASIDKDSGLGKIDIYSNARCMDNSLEYAESDRKIAIVTVLEAGGIVCYGN